MTPGAPPSDASDLSRQQEKRNSPRADAVSKEARQARLARLVDSAGLPSPPALTLKVLEKASQPDCTLADLEGLITLDPGLCSKILRTINSSRYGLSRPVVTIRQALFLLGIQSVRSLVLGLSLPEMKGRGQRPIPVFWKVSVAGAVLARELGRHLGWPRLEDLLLAGLLQDLGVLVLSQVFPEEYVGVNDWSMHQGALPTCEMEEEVFGLNHAELSAYILGRWRLPGDLVEAIRYHHHPELAARQAPHVEDYAWLLYFANQTALLQLNPFQPALLQDVFGLAERRYGMSENALRAFLTPIHTEIQVFSELANVDVGKCEEYGEIMARAVSELAKMTQGADGPPQAGAAPAPTNPGD